MAFAQRRAGRSLAIIVAGSLALAAFSLLTARPGDAAATWVVTFSGAGASPTSISASEGDVIVFKNSLPLTPLTGALVPVNVNYDGEQFSVGDTPVGRTITRSASFMGSYAVLGLIPLMNSGGTVTVAKAMAPPSPSSPSTGGGTVTPPSTGGGTVTPPATGGGTATVPSHPGGTLPAVTPPAPSDLTKIPVGDPGTTPRTPVVPAPAHQAGVVAASGAGSQSAAAVARQPKGGAGSHSLVSDSSSTSSAFGLVALAGGVLLLGVGVALTRAMLTGRGMASPATA
jgi:hypothetical protein